jgi:hypothetical protein
MNPRIAISSLILAGWVCGPGNTRAADTPEKKPGSEEARAKPTGYQAFPFVRLRNIFDPNRKPVRIDSPAAKPLSKPRAALTLTGTLVTEQKALAFFSGPGGDLGKVLGIAQAIGDFKITSIAPGQVGLERDGQPLVLAVGKSLPMEGGAETSAVLENIPAVGVPETPAPAPASPPSPAPNADANPDRSETLRRMMERRQKELSQ